MTTDETGMGAGGEGDEPLAPNLAEASVSEGESVLDQLRKLREEKANAEPPTCIIPIAGWQGMLVAKYRLVPVREMQKRGKQLRKQAGSDDAANLIASIETLVLACTEVMVRDNADAEPQPIDPTAETPIAFDSRLATLLKLNASTAREVVVELFPTEYAIIATAVELSAWMRNTSYEIDTETLGE